MKDRVFVSQDFLDHAARLNACGTLNMEQPWKSCLALFGEGELIRE